MYSLQAEECNKRNGGTTRVDKTQHQKDDKVVLVVRVQRNESEAFTSVVKHVQVRNDKTSGVAVGNAFQAFESTTA